MENCEDGLLPERSRKVLFIEHTVIWHLKESVKRCDQSASKGSEQRQTDYAGKQMSVPSEHSIGMV